MKPTQPTGPLLRRCGAVWLVLLCAAVAHAAPSPRADDPGQQVDPKLLETYEKLGIPLREQSRLAGVAMDAVFDSVSVGTTFKEALAEKGVIFWPCSTHVVLIWSNKAQNTGIEA